MQRHGYYAASHAHRLVLRRSWLIIERPEVDLCLKDPGAEVDLYVRADLKAFARIWLGDMLWSEGLGPAPAGSGPLRSSAGRPLQMARSH